jgi:hypothetical protein
MGKAAPMGLTAEEARVTMVVRGGINPQKAGQGR